MQLAKLLTQGRQLRLPSSHPTTIFTFGPCSALAWGLGYRGREHIKNILSPLHSIACCCCCCCCCCWGRCCCCSAPPRRKPHACVRPRPTVRAQSGEVGACCLPGPGPRGSQCPAQDLPRSKRLQTTADCRESVLMSPHCEKCKVHTVKICRHVTTKILTTFSSEENDDKPLSVDDRFVICDDRFVT